MLKFRNFWMVFTENRKMKIYELSGVYTMAIIALS